MRLWTNFCSYSRSGFVHLLFEGESTRRTIAWDHTDWFDNSIIMKIILKLLLNVYPVVGAVDDAAKASVEPHYKSRDR